MLSADWYFVLQRLLHWMFYCTISTNTGLHESGLPSPCQSRLPDHPAQYPQPPTLLSLHVPVHCHSLNPEQTRSWCKVRLKIVYLTQIRARPHLLTARKQLLAETSSVSSLDDSVQKEAVAWPGPGCSMGAFSKRSKPSALPGWWPSIWCWRCEWAASIGGGCWLMFFNITIVDMILQHTKYMTEPEKRLSCIKIVHMQLAKNP